MGNKFVKGLKKDSRFGKVLAVNFNPYKVCNFNCIYCGVGPTTDKTIERKEFYPPEMIFEEISNYIDRNGEPNYIWVVGNGEPTLYSSFGKLCNLIRRMYPNVKIAISTNASLFYREDVREEFSFLDLVLIELVSVSHQEFSEICRQHEDIKINHLLEGIKLFREIFKGEMILVSVFLEGINDNQKNLDGIKNLLLELKPSAYILKNYACRGYKSLDGEFKKIVQNTFNDLPCEVIYKF